MPKSITRQPVDEVDETVLEPAEVEPIYYVGD
jgi:hypothetical protein